MLGTQYVSLLTTYLPPVVKVLLLITPYVLRYLQLKLYFLPARVILRVAEIYPLRMESKEQLGVLYKNL